MKANSFFNRIINKIKLLFRKDKEFCLLLYNLLDFLPDRTYLYRRALTHSSIVSGHKRKLDCNERLEFLGDAVLGAVTTDYVYKKYGREHEGFLSKTRSRVVCRENLNILAINIGLDKLVNVGEIPYSHNNYIYGNAFEALIGAIYIDKGFEQCRKFIIEKVYIPFLDIEAIAKSDNNYKSRLIEWSQKEHREVVFSLQSEDLRSEGAFFVSNVFVDGVLFGCGEGFSKRESQQNAAKKALQQIMCNAMNSPM